jgi:hypothetical protein
MYETWYLLHRYTGFKSKYRMFALFRWTVLSRLKYLMKEFHFEYLKISHLVRNVIQVLFSVNSVRSLALNFFSFQAESA